MSYPPQYDENEVAFLSGVDASGHVAAGSFQTWGGNNDPTHYLDVSNARKWGSPVAGTGASVTFGFDPASQWTTTEQNSFVASMHLWQAEANIHFTAAADPSRADIIFTRGHDGKAEGYLAGTSVPVGNDTLGIAVRGGVQIDTNTAGFGPLGSSFSLQGGYAWMTELHEIGHAIGLGHAGSYDGDAGNINPNGSYDNRSMSIMSYIDGGNWPYPDWGTYGGYAGEPTTPMMLDIVATQRLYGTPTDGPLSGDVVFGFNSNIQGDIRPFFDFTVNSHPVVTLWSGGAHNTLDVSGFAQNASLNLNAGDGYASSAGGLVRNIYIAPGTHVTSAIAGMGDDSISGNDDHDVLIGGAGSDVINAGAGNDHIYGGGTTVTPGDGADLLRGGGGTDYLQGNAGDDTLDGGDGSDRLYGGADDDSLFGNTGNDSIQGNLGNDRIDGGDGDDFLRGGQGDDTIQGNAGNDIVMGDLGNDWIDGGRGFDTLIGGAGADVFDYAERAATYSTRLDWADPYRLDEVADFQDGIDHIRLDAGIPLSVTQLGVQASVQAASDLATGLLTSASNQNDGFRDVAVAQVGHDAIFFFWGSAIGMEAARIDNFDASHFTVADFV
jgi:serralysin